MVTLVDNFCSALGKHMLVYAYFDCCVEIKHAHAASPVLGETILNIELKLFCANCIYNTYTLTISNEHSPFCVICQ